MKPTQVLEETEVESLPEVHNLACGKGFGGFFCLKIILTYIYTLYMNGYTNMITCLFLLEINFDDLYHTCVFIYTHLLASLLLSIYLFCSLVVFIG